jgi:hypothetical protein
MGSSNVVHGAEEAQRALQANRSPRYCRLNELERWVDTTQYDHRKHDFFADTEEAPPLRERRPCIAYPVVRSAIDSNVDLCFGEGKFPAIVLTDGDDGEGAEDKLSEDTRETIDNGITKLIQAAKLKPVFRGAMVAAQACGTAVGIVGARDGVPFVELEQAKRCTAKFGPDGCVTSLEVLYPYTVEIKQTDGTWLIEARLYRRVVDESRDVTYKPVKAPLDGRKVTWVEDPDRSVVHGLGFCPVVWYAHMVGVTTAEQVDGVPIHAHCLDEIEALDFGLSQWHRASFYAGDPLIVETGVANGRPMADGVGLGDRAVPSSLSGGPLADKNPENGSYVAAHGGHRKPARKKGPGMVWSYSSKDSKVDILALPGDALKVIQDNCRDLREKVAESLGVVFSDPDTVRFASALSGKAQQMLRQRQLDRCDQYRDDIGDGFVIPVVQMLLRLCRTLGTGIKSRAIRDAAKASEKLGEKPGITLRWGDYYAPEPAEEKATAEALAAIDKIVPLPMRIKLQKLARILDIENVDAVLEEIEAEQEEREAKAQEQAEAGAKALMSAAHGNGPVGRTAKPGAGANPQAPTSGGGRSAAAAASKNAQRPG